MLCDHATHSRPTTRPSGATPWRGCEKFASSLDMRFGIECKFKEPRTRMFFSNVANTLLAIQAMGVNNVGIVFDLSHSFLARETPAKALQLAARHNTLTNTHWLSFCPLSLTVLKRNTGRIQCVTANST